MTEKYKGVKIFPIKRNAKFPPLVKDWENVATDDPAQIAAWKEQFPGCNWGVACGPSNLIIVDEDEPGSIAALEAEGVVFPPSRAVQTPRPGRHLYYRGRCRSGIKCFPGVDIKSAGGYVLAPGSKTSGGEYVVIEDLPVAPAPATLLKLLQDREPREPRKREPACELDSPSAVLRAKEYADFQAPASIQGEGGDANAYKVACRIRDLGVSRDVCLEILFGRWNGRCDPPWDFEELEKKVRNAYEYARGQAGSASPEADFGDLPDEEPLPDFGALPDEEPLPEDPKLAALRRALDFNFLAAEFKPRRPLIKNLLHESDLMILSAAAGAGKTLLALTMAAALTRGGALWGPYSIPEPVGVLYFDGEMNCTEFQKRIRSMAIQPDSDLFRVISSEWLAQTGLPQPNLVDPAWRKAIIDLVRHWPDCRVIVFDNIVSLAPGYDENSAEEWSPINQFLLKLRRAGVAAIPVHHNNKSGSQRGTSARMDNLDVGIKLEPLERPNTTVRVEFTKARSLPAYLRKPFVLTRTEDEAGWWWARGDIADGTSDRILFWYAKGLSQADIAVELGLHKSTISRAIAKARADGLVNLKVRELTEKGRHRISGLMDFEGDVAGVACCTP